MKRWIVMAVGLFLFVGCSHHGMRQTGGVLQGIFLCDVAGVEYNTTSGLRGVTDEKGTFFYKEGDEVTFWILGQELGSVRAKKGITPFDFGMRAQEVSARLLEVDEDHNLSNGVLVSQAGGLRVGENEALKRFARCIVRKFHPFTLHIAHINDIHSHLESEKFTFAIDFDKDPSNGNELKIETKIGGMAKVKRKIDELKRRSPDLLVINAGDLIEGTIYFTLFEGNATLAFYNALWWDVFEIGNHEFDEGDRFLATLLERMRSHTGAILGTNIEPDGLTIPKDLIRPYTILRVGGEEIGIVGIDVVGKTKASSRPSEHIHFLPELQTAQYYIDKLRNQGIEKIVLVTHIGLKKDVELARQLHGVDLIVGGDSHSLMGDFEAIGLLSERKEYPLVVKNGDGKPVCIVQAWSYARAVGDLRAAFDVNGDVVACWGDAVVLLSNRLQRKGGGELGKKERERVYEIIEKRSNIEIVPDDATLLALLELYKKEIAQRKREVVAVVPHYLSHNRIPYDRYDGKRALPHGSEVAPLVCKAFLAADPHADLCIQNAGGVRQAIERGELTVGEVYAMLPFRNTLYEVRMSGKEIKEALEDGLSNYLDAKGSTGSFPYGYKIRYDIDATAPKGKRVTNLQFLGEQGWEPLREDRTYVVVTSSYVATGHDGYATFAKLLQEGKGVDTYLDYAMSFVKFAKKVKKLEKIPASLLPVRCYVDERHPTCPR